MTQQTLTKQIVHAACDDLSALQGKFSFKELHAHIGHGTMSNVHRWGKEWKAQQEAPARFETLPRNYTDQIIAMAVSTWDAAARFSAAEEEAVATRLEREKSILSEQNMDLEGQLESALEERNRFEADSIMVAELEKRLEQEVALTSTLEDDLAETRTRHASETDELTLQRSTLSDQVEKLQERIADVSAERDRYQRSASEVTGLHKKLKVADDAINKASATIDGLRKENNTAQAKNRELGATIQTLRLALVTSETREGGLREQVSLLKSQLEWSQKNSKATAEV